MPRYRKKPVEIDAIQLRPDGDQDWNQITEFFGSASGDGLWRAVGYGVEIETLEGTHRGDPGDWIIRGIAGEFYPCKPDIFEASYVEVPLA